MAKLVDTPVIEPQERFPGLPHLAANAPEPVLARLWSGTELEGKLTAFIAAAEELEIELPGGPRRMKFSEIQWLKFTRPVEYRSNAEAFRKRGLHVETPVGRTPFSLAFTDGHVKSSRAYPTTR